MTVLTQIGEMRVVAKCGEFNFRPSLYAMSLLPDPVDFLKIFHASDTSDADRFFMAHQVLKACSDGADLSDLVGYYRPPMTKNSRRTLLWVPGEMPPTDVVVFAANLLLHGLCGNFPPEDEDGSERKSGTSEFEPLEIVSISVAHLGMTEHDAWRQTMTGFIGVMRAKYPKPKPKNPTVKEAGQLMSWLDAVNSVRDGAK